MIQSTLARRLQRMLDGKDPIPFTEEYWKALRRDLPDEYFMKEPTPIDTHTEFLQKLRTAESPNYFAVWRNDDGSWTTYRCVDGKYSIEASAILIRAGIRLLGFEPQ